MIEDALDHGLYAESPSADKSPDSQLTTPIAYYGDFPGAYGSFGPGSPVSP